MRAVKKRQIFSAFMTALLTAVLSIGCEAVAGGTDINSSSNGNVVLVITPPARTIMPHNIIIAQYVINIQDTDKSGKLTPPDNTIRFALDPGSYTAEVTALMTADDINSLAAKGSESFTVSPDSTNNSFTVNLTWDLPALLTGEDGTFEWDFDFTDFNLATATMRIDNLGTGAFDFIPLNSTNYVSNIKHPPGQYSIDVKLETAASDKVFIWQILHIYKNMTSYYKLDMSNRLPPPPTPSTPGLWIVVTGPAMPEDNIEVGFTNISGGTVSGNTVTLDSTNTPADYGTLTVQGINGYDITGKQIKWSITTDETGYTHEGMSLTSIDIDSGSSAQFSDGRTQYTIAVEVDDEIVHFEIVIKR